MKRIFAVVIAVLLILGTMFCLTGCGNMSMGPGNYTFTHVHFSDATEGYCGTVEKWYDNETGVEATTKEYGSMFLSEGSYIMFSDQDKCPYCQ